MKYAKDALAVSGICYELCSLCWIEISSKPLPGKTAPVTQIKDKENGQ